MRENGKDQEGSGEVDENRGKGNWNECKGRGKREEETEQMMQDFVRK